jgi:hypothetical protein
VEIKQALAGLVDQTVGWTVYMVSEPGCMPPDELVGHSCNKIYHCDIGSDICIGIFRNIWADPRFVTGPMGDYYLSQIAAGETINSPCVDKGSDTAINLGMNIFTTRTDELRDEGTVDMGYHYAILPGSVDIDENLHVDCFDYSMLAADW